MRAEWIVAIVAVVAMSLLTYSCVDARTQWYKAQEVCIMNGGSQEYGSCKK